MTGLFHVQPSGRGLCLSHSRGGGGRVRGFHAQLQSVGVIIAKNQPIMCFYSPAPCHRVCFKSPQIGTHTDFLIWHVMKYSVLNGAHLYPLKPLKWSWRWSSLAAPQCGPESHESHLMSGVNVSTIANGMQLCTH